MVAHSSSTEVIRLPGDLEQEGVTAKTTAAGRKKGRDFMALAMNTVSAALLAGAMADRASIHALPTGATAVGADAVGVVGGRLPMEGDAGEGQHGFREERFHGFRNGVVPP